MTGARILAALILSLTFCALRAEDPMALTCIVSGHGFAGVERELNLNLAFIGAGLVTPNPNRSSFPSPSVLEWRAEPWLNGGSAAIVLKDPHDTETLDTLDRLLHTLAADSTNGIEQILDRKTIAELGGDPDVPFWVDMKPGYDLGTAMTGPLRRDTKVHGTHGFSPVHSEMWASFIRTGLGIKKGLDLGAIDMRSIAPTLAHLLHVSLATADLPPLAGSGALRALRMSARSYSDDQPILATRRYFPDGLPQARIARLVHVSQSKGSRKTAERNINSKSISYRRLNNATQVRSVDEGFILSRDHFVCVFSRIWPDHIRKDRGHCNRPDRRGRSQGASNTREP
jgi:hypothetical protein